MWGAFRVTASMNTPEDLRQLLTGADPVAIARALLGVEIITRIDGVETGGMITETEAYRAPDDRASHAYGNRRTARTAPFFRVAGTAYVYLCYGIHELFNVITGPEGVPHAVLIRAVAPTRGVETIQERRVMKTLRAQLTSGPGVVSRALGITRAHNGLDLLDPTGPVHLAVTGRRFPPSEVVATPRIGIDGAGPEWAAKPWRFYVKSSPYVSRRNAFA